MIYQIDVYFGEHHASSQIMLQVNDSVQNVFDDFIEGDYVDMTDFRDGTVTFVPMSKIDYIVFSKIEEEDYATKARQKQIRYIK